MMQKSMNGPMLAGVCSRLAGRLRFNVWVLRGLFVLLLLVKTFLAVVVYVGLALLFQLLDKGAKSASDLDGDSPEIAADRFDRSRRIEELDRRFRAWEDSLER